MVKDDNAYFWNGPLAGTWGHIPPEHDRLIISDSRVNDEAFEPYTTLKSPDHYKSFFLYRHYCTYYLPIYTYEDGNRVFTYVYTPDDKYI